MAAKAQQTHVANRYRVSDPKFNVGDKVMLSTKNRRREYHANDDRRVAKFMPRYDGPYTVSRDIYIRPRHPSLSLGVLGV